MTDWPLITGRILPVDVPIARYGGAKEGGDRGALYVPGCSAIWVYGLCAMHNIPGPEHTIIVAQLPGIRPRPSVHLSIVESAGRGDR